MLYWGSSMQFRLSEATHKAVYAVMLVAVSAAAPARASHGEDPAMELKDDRPIGLAVHDADEYLNVSVVAGVPCACSGRFTIESSAGTGNRSVNSGTFNGLTAPGAVLTRVRVRHRAQWDVRLTVEIDGQAPYSEYHTSAKAM